MNRYKLVITFLALSFTLGGGISFVSSVWAVFTFEEIEEKTSEEIQRGLREAKKRIFEEGGKRRSQAILELQPLAENGDSEAQFALGKIYHDEEGALRQEYDFLIRERLPITDPVWFGLAKLNREHAETWLVRSAKQGNLQAQKFLWEDFFNSESDPYFPGSSEDKKKKFHWVQIVAERGHPESQYYLGEEYLAGKFLLQDYSKALHWLGLAAEQEHIWAMWKLGVLYSEIKGVEEDLVQAHKWFNLAHVSSKRDALAKEMTNEQIAEAQRLAREWKVKGK